MSTNPSPLKRAFVCPLCGEPIDALEPHETRNAPAPDDWEPNLSVNYAQNAAQFAMAQNMAANEALIWAHFESYHSLREAVLALGVARNALMEIRPLADDMRKYETSTANLIDDLVDRGLGGK